MSIELPVATRQRRDMTEKLLKATLNPNTHTRNLPRWLWEWARSRSQTLESAHSVQLFLGFIYIAEGTEVAIRVYDMSYLLCHERRVPSDEYAAFRKLARTKVLASNSSFERRFVQI